MQVNVIGAGLAGLTCAITLAKKNIICNLISIQPSERAQSNMASGGINGALNTMGEDDSVEQHVADTLKSGGYIANEEAVNDMCSAAPEIIKWLYKLGVPFDAENGRIVQRLFGSQKKKRTAYSGVITGKQIMNVLIDESRKYEAQGIIRRYDHHEFISLDIVGMSCQGVNVFDLYKKRCIHFKGRTVLCFGGMNGLFHGLTTGSCANTSDALARVFAQGVRLSNLEMIQFHPTTIQIPGKRCLVSEAARSWGGRFAILQNGRKYYFLEEKHPDQKNLIARDVASREIFFMQQVCRESVYLDMTGIKASVWRWELSDLKKELMHYTGIDPAKNIIPILPGIHYFMGGIDVDVNHKTNIDYLYAAGECCSQYHGANRLGANSVLGAIYGGSVAAEDIIMMENGGRSLNAGDVREPEAVYVNNPAFDAYANEKIDPEFAEQLTQLLYGSLGIVRDEKTMSKALEMIIELSGVSLNSRERERVALAKAILQSALYRKESRGAHTRSDYPVMLDEYKGVTTADFAGVIHIDFRGIAE